MSGFTKLVPEIIRSSIWDEPPEIRCVWITMLAVKDADGYVRGTPSSLQRMSNVGMEHVHKALQIFEADDLASHTPDHDGKRIESVPGGWVILNHDLYKARDMNAEHAEYMRNWRKKKDVTKRDSHVKHASVSVSDSVSVSGVEGESEGEGVGCGIVVPLTPRDGDYEPPQKLVDEWATCYPGVDVPQTLREIRAWNLANPTRRKTRRGILKHINGWLNKEQCNSRAPGERCKGRSPSMYELKTKLDLKQTRFAQLGENDRDNETRRKLRVEIRELKRQIEEL